MLIESWSRLVALSSSYLIQLLRFEDKQESESEVKPSAHLWKMNAIEMLALAVCYDVPIVQRVEDV